MGKLIVSTKTPPNPRPNNPRFLSMVVGNIPRRTNLEDLKPRLDAHCRAVDISPLSESDVYTKWLFSNLFFVKCQSESHRDRFIPSIKEVAIQHRRSNQVQPSAQILPRFTYGLNGLMFASWKAPSLQLNNASSVEFQRGMHQIRHPHGNPLFSWSGSCHCG